jgi:hypothetical protein
MAHRRILVDGEGGFKGLPTFWGNPEHNPEFRAAFRAPRMRDPEEVRKWQEANAGTIRASLIELGAQWDAERDVFRAALVESERKAKG